VGEMDIGHHTSEKYSMESLSQNSCKEEKLVTGRGRNASFQKATEGLDASFRKK
jgi:hypothetical protein